MKLRYLIGPVFFAIALSALEHEPEKYCFKPFMDLLTVDEIKNVSEKHLKNDLPFQAAINYIRTSQFKKSVEDLRNAQSWQEYKNFLKEIYIDIDSTVDILTHCIDRANVTGTIPKGIEPNISNFLNETLNTAALHFDLAKLFFIKMKCPHFQKCYAKLASNESQILLEKALVLPEMKTLIGELKKIGVDVEDHIQFFYNLFGWKKA